MKLSLVVLLTFSLNGPIWASNRHRSSYSSRKTDYTNRWQAKAAHSRSPTYKDLIPIYEGKNLEFGFPSESIRRHAIDSGLYDPNKPLPIDVDVYYETSSHSRRVFVTIPRFGSGVPYSLAYLTDVQRANGSEFQPYPDYSWHSSHGADCNGLTSIYRIQIDSCGQMWVLDSGEIGLKQYCPPSLAVFDLKTDTMVHRYFLPEDMYKPKISRFVTPTIDIADPAPHGRCQHAMAYLADATGLGFVVYDFVHGRSWRIENKYTYPDPDFGTHTIAGESFELTDGTFTFALTPPNLGLTRMLYFHSLSNDIEVAIPLDIVNNETIWQNGMSSGLQHFMRLGRRGVQCGASAMTADGILLCGFLEPIALVGWNIRTPYAANNLFPVAENPTTLQFVAGLKIIKNPFTGKDEVWALSNRLQKSFTGKQNFNEINYRIQRCGVEELLHGKGVCK